VREKQEDEKIESEKSFYLKLSFSHLHNKPK